MAPVLSGGVSLGGSGFQLTFSGPSGETYKVLSTTNLTTPLASWSLLTNGTFSTGSVIFLDPTTAGNPVKFYRITAP